MLNNTANIKINGILAMEIYIKNTNMSFILENYKLIQSNLPKEVALIPVSKTHSNEVIMELYTNGCKVFGESRPQELKAKSDALPKDIEWHMIGNLQRNKVKYIAPFVYLIHSVDSLRLLRTIDKEAQKNNRIIPCLLQIKIAKEEAKSGFDFDELKAIISSDDFDKLKHIRICGLMGMATFSEDVEVVRGEFKEMKQHFEELRETIFFGSKDFKILSMGMSGDYLIAIEEGSTMVRVGSNIFGSR